MPKERNSGFDSIPSGKAVAKYSKLTLSAPAHERRMDDISNAEMEIGLRRSNGDLD